MENPCDEQVSKALWENNKRHVEQIERLLAETREECAQRLDALVKKWRDIDDARGVVGCGDISIVIRILRLKLRGRNVIADDIVRPRGSPRFVDCQDESVADCADTLAELAEAIRSHKEGQ